MFYYLYLILDIYSRYIVGWEVWESESAENASLLIRKTVLKHGIQPHAHPLVLHSDNGSPMKGAIMLETMYKLGITPSRSRPRVSDDNPYSLSSSFYYPHVIKRYALFSLFFKKDEDNL